MCIGVPMQVVALDAGAAWCEGMGERRRVDMLLVGEQPVGSWVLVFLNTAREVIDETQARRTADALQALQLAMQGERQVDHLFADLVDREPELPDFLHPATDKSQ
jgi:hydrogenase expression/formation protein HypC